jgi:N-acetyl-gamma-glutamyl-phosphate reductase
MGQRIAILGASGYAGGELVRLVDGHPDLELAYLGGHSSAGSRLGDLHPQLSGGDRLIGPLDGEDAGEVDLAFLALPHGASAEPAVALRRRGVKVVDLGSDFRLSSPDLYLEAYGSPHPHPDQLGEWVYGLPELFADAVAASEQVAAPGCYPTSATLALAPLLAAGLIEPHVIVSSMSGVSGAGRGMKESLMFGAVAEGVAAYSVLTHRHRPEIEQALAQASGSAATVVFTPHLVPMQRGLLSTCHATVLAGVDQDVVVDCLRTAYAGAPFVEVIDSPPQTRWVVGSNRCLLSAHVDPRTGTAIVIAAIDNLVKGAAGQAVQCANLMFGLPEAQGLTMDGWMP